MTPELRALWVADLRSGKHDQGKGEMHNAGTDQWCCLGRLRDITPTPLVETLHDDGSWTDEPLDPEINDAEPATEEERMWGLTSQECATFMSLNDGLVEDKYNPMGATHTFAEIADWIEENLK